MEFCADNTLEHENWSVGLPQGVNSLIVNWSDPRSVQIAAKSILAGESVVVPSETIYGLTCNALNARAVEQLYRIKGRELTKPSAVFLGNRENISAVAEVTTAMAERVIEKFLPGPLTVVLNSRLGNLVGVVGVDGKIGIRISSHPFIQALCRRVSSPIIATSANISGLADCRTEGEVLASFNGLIPVIIFESTALTERSTTVVDLTGERPLLLRDGTIPFSEVLNCAEGNQ